MEVRKPTWRLRGLCPVCGQGSCLALLECPACGRIVVACEEEGSVFLDPRNLLAAASDFSSSTSCPGCGQRQVTEFVPASDTAIRSGGFTIADYE
jgi:hypothetical protein